MFFSEVGNVQCTIDKNVEHVWQHDELVKRNIFDHHLTCTTMNQFVLNRNTFIVKLNVEYWLFDLLKKDARAQVLHRNCADKTGITIIFKQKINRNYHFITGRYSIKLNKYRKIMKSGWFIVTFTPKNNTAKISWKVLLSSLCLSTDSICKTPQDASLRAINVQNKNKMQSRAYIGTVAGQRGNPKLVLNGYTYIPNKRIEKKTYWNCAHVRQKKCKARLITLGSMDNIIVTYPQVFCWMACHFDCVKQMSYNFSSLNHSSTHIPKKLPFKINLFLSYHRLRIFCYTIDDLLTISGWDGC